MPCLLRASPHGNDNDAHCSPHTQTRPQLDKEEAQTEKEAAEGAYADVPRPGGARDRIRAEIRKEDAEAYKRLASA